MMYLSIAVVVALAIKMSSADLVHGKFVFIHKPLSNVTSLLAREHFLQSAYSLCKQFGSTLPPTNHLQAPRKECVTGNYFFLFLNQNICFGYSKEPSR